MYLIRVGGFLHHGTSRKAEHEAYAARLIEAGHDVTTEQTNLFCHDTSHMARNGANVDVSESPATAATVRGDDRLARSR